MHSPMLTQLWHFYSINIPIGNIDILMTMLESGIHAGLSAESFHIRIEHIILWDTRLARGAAGRRLDYQCDLDSDFQSSQQVNFWNLSLDFDRSARGEASHSLEVMSHTFLRWHWMTWAQPKISGPSESRKCAPKLHFWCDFGLLVS